MRKVQSLGRILKTTPGGHEQGGELRKFFERDIIKAEENPYIPRSRLMEMGFSYAKIA
jgi:hypothetical protein